MSLADLVRKLNAVKEQQSDAEAAHQWADDALLEYINDPEVTRAYGEITKWYA